MERTKQGVTPTTKTVKGHGTYNVYETVDNIVICTCLNGKTFIFDRDDYEIVKRHIWHITENGYVKSGSGQKCIRLHRLLTNASRGYDVDHINGNPADNRRCNLRVVTHHENTINVGRRKNSKSGFKGVCWTSREKRFRAYIFVNGHQLSLGYYDNPIEAARAYDSAALQYFGEFARLNFERSDTNADAQILEMAQ